MRPAVHILLACLLISITAMAGEAVVTLERLDDSPTTGPYCRAALTVHNDSDVTIREVRLKWQLGCPTAVHRLVVAPGQAETLTIELPAIDTRQIYDVALVTEDVAAEPVTVQATIEWAPAQLDPSALIDSMAYEAAETIVPFWPNRLRRNVWLAALVGGLAMTGVLLIRQRPLRTGMALVVIVTGLIAAGLFVRQQRTVFQQFSDDGKVIVLTARRTATWTTSQTALIPIYASRQQRMEDATVMEPDQMSVALQPGQIKLFRLPADARP